MKNRFKLEIKTNSEEIIKHILLEVDRVFDKYGAVISPKNKATKKLFEEYTE